MIFTASNACTRGLRSLTESRHRNTKLGKPRIPKGEKAKVAAELADRAYALMLKKPLCVPDLIKALNSYETVVRAALAALIEQKRAIRVHGNRGVKAFYRGVPSP